jgi:DNA-binding transcriptional ArsR family regulator
MPRGGALTRDRARAVIPRRGGRRGDSITLLPLRLPEAIKLYASSAHGVTKATPLELYEKTGGLPSAILFAAGRSSEAFPAAPRRYAGPSGTPSAGRLDADERLILWTLVLLGRPATIDELRRLLGPRKRIDARLAALEAAGLVSAAESGKWTASSGAVARLASEDPRRSRRRLHLAIARKLVASGEGDATCVEAARHLIAAGAARELVPIARRAVRYLQRTCQNRAALELLPGASRRAASPECIHAPRAGSRDGRPPRQSGID